MTIFDPTGQMKKKTGKAVKQAGPAYDPLSDLEVGEVLGSFMGYLRRAKANSQGMTAQVFGENGTDADFIATMFLTKFLDAHVKVSIWMVKDRHGKPMLNENKEPPLLCSFIGSIRRPMSSRDGHTAQLFAENGPNADAVNLLNVSAYLDALVLVELQKSEPGMSVADITTDTPSDELAEAQTRLTAEETSNLKKQQKQAHQALTLLRQSGFFTQPSVLSALGSPMDYEAWLAEQGCCHPGQQPCQGHDVRPFILQGVAKQYNAIPFCQDHHDAWSAEVLPDVGPQGGLGFLTSQMKVYNQRWAQNRLRHALKVPVGYDPTPHSIFAWVVNHRLRALLPSTFETFLD